MLEKKLKIEELNIRNGLCEIKAGKTSILAKEDTFNKFGIPLTKECLGKDLIITLEPKEYKVIKNKNVYSDNLESNDVFIGDIEKIQTRSRFYRILGKPSMEDKTEYIVSFYTQVRGGTLTILPTPYYKIKLKLSEEEYKQLLELPTSTIMRVRCRLEA
jgi:hypothetical protein